VWNGAFEWNMGWFVWNSMFKAAGLLLTQWGGPGAVGSRCWALRFPRVQR